MFCCVLVVKISLFLRFRFGSTVDNNFSVLIPLFCAIKLIISLDSSFVKIIDDSDNDNKIIDDNDNDNKIIDDSDNDDKIIDDSDNDNDFYYISIIIKFLNVF